VYTCVCVCVCIYIYISYTYKYIYIAFAPRAHQSLSAVAFAIYTRSLLTHTRSLLTHTRSLLTHGHVLQNGTVARTFEEILLRNFACIA
jgi:hypothetical protein